MKENLYRAEIALVTLLVVVALFLSARFYLFDYILSGRAINSDKIFNEFVVQHHPITISDVKYIRQWMTFEYIDRVFALPNDYLKTTLNITNTKYPRIAVARYAKEENISVDSFLGQVKDAVNQYVLNKPTP